MKRFIKLISVFLLLATLLPLAVACAGDPPPPSNNDNDTPNNSDNTPNESQGGEQGGDGTPSEEEQKKAFCISSKFKEYDTLVLTDFESESFKSVNSNVDSYLETKDGQVGYRYNTTKQPVTFTLENPETDLSDYHYISFSVYNEAPSDLELSIRMVGWRATPTFTLNFSGWRTFYILIDSFTVVNPLPTVSDIIISKSSGTDGTVYISEVSAALPVYEISAPQGVSLSDESIYKAVCKKCWASGAKRLLNLPSIRRSTA